jgi:WD40 repeat protein
MLAQRQIQQSQLPPAQPLYILRGHKAQIHALQFLCRNSRLLSGDADGFIILWDTATKRPRAVWKGHTGSILGFGAWDDDKVISHGRDGKLNVWHLRDTDEDGLSQELPVDGGIKNDWKQPWLLHSLHVHTLNFCAFALCKAEGGRGILVATPAANEGATVIHALPSEETRHLVPPADFGKTGMVMALRIAFLDGFLHVVTGYESGFTSVQRLEARTEHRWETISVCKPHTQPILSLDILPSSSVYFTSSADAVISMASLRATSEKRPLKTNDTKHSGQQGLTVRSDGKIFATAGWDGRMRVYSAKSLKEVAVLKWHKEGCYTVAFAQISAADALLPKLGGTATQLNSKDANELSDQPDEKGLVSVSDTQQITTVRQRRKDKACDTHWLAAGSKDGKISLWDIF